MFAEGVADLVSEGGGERDKEAQRPQWGEGVVGGGHDSGGEQEGVPGEDEADEDSGLHEDDEEDPCETEGGQQTVNVEHAAMASLSQEEEDGAGAGRN